MDDAGLTAKLEKPAPIAANGLEAVSLTFGDTFERTSAMFDAGLNYWRTEYLRWVDEAAADGRATFARLLKSKTPLDVLSAEHDWLRARSRSFLESGIRLVDALAMARSAKEDSLERPLPRKRDRAA